MLPFAAYHDFIVTHPSHANFNVNPSTPMHVRFLDTVSECAVALWVSIVIMRVPEGVGESHKLFHCIAVDVLTSGLLHHNARMLILVQLRKFGSNKNRHMTMRASGSTSSVS